MMSLSRRSLARYAVDEMEAGKKPAQIAKHLVAAMNSVGSKRNIEFLISDIEQVLEERKISAKARVTSVHPLTQSLKSEVISSVKKATGVKSVRLENEIDKSLIGGVKIETASHSWDKSIKQRLENIKESI